MTLAERVAASYAERLRSFGSRAPGRFVEEVAGLLVVSLGVDESWGTIIPATEHAPDPAAVEAAMAWCRERGRVPQVVVRARDVALLDHLRPVDVLPTFAAEATSGDRALVVDRSPGLAEFHAVYGRAFGMRPGLARALVTAADLEASDVMHLVVRIDGAAVGCAQLRTGDALTYVSGVGVVPERQRQGIGTDVLAVCRAEAARLGSTHLWLNASERSAPFYDDIGFELVDTYVALS